MCAPRCVLLFAFFGALFPALCSSRTFLSHFHERYQAPPTQAELFFPQRIDHFDLFNDSKFQQRYFVDESVWKAPDGPVLLNICGEYTCVGVFPFRQYANIIAQDNGALIVSLEHRFYGKSQPATLATEYLRWLTTEQALADLAYFTEYLQNQINEKYNKTTSNAWVVVGGSYPGALAAWYRIKYPHLSVGSLASSGVVNAILEYSQFDQQVAASAAKSSDDCTAALQLATQQVEAAMPEIKASFLASDLVDRDFLFLIADAVAEGIQYGHRHEICDQMIPAYRANASLAHQLANYTVNFFYPVMGSSADDYNTPLLTNQTTDTGGGRQWLWQTCSELAYFQVAPIENPIRSTQLSLDYFQWQCSTAFPEFTVFPPNVDAINNEYGGASPAGTNIIFSNGCEDPWQHASVLPASSRPHRTAQHLSPTETSVLIQCDQCAHCVDLYTPTAQDAPELVAARSFISNQIHQWLSA